MNEVTEKVALFFYFAFLDEVRAGEATRAVLKKIRQKDAAIDLTGVESSGRLIALCEKYAAAFQRQVKPSGLSFSAGQIELPEGSNWGPWFEFRRLAEQKDFYAVIWTRVLGLSEEALAKGVHASSGTIRYRVGRGLKTLGRICQSGGLDA